MKKQILPSTQPQLICQQCGNHAPEYEKWAHDDHGQVFLAAVDAWPTYYRDVAGVRVEFCSCECGVAWMQKKQLSP